MAAEIVPYHLIDDIYDDFKREDIALDYIDPVSYTHLNGDFGNFIDLLLHKYMDYF